MNNAFQQILLNYSRARRKKLSKFEKAEVASSFRFASNGIRESDSFKRRKKDVIIKFGTGMGVAAHIPWLALLNKRITNTTQRGVYCAYLFRADFSGIFLTLTQGVNDPDKNLQSLIGNAIELRKRLGGLKAFGFSLDEKMTLRDSGVSGQQYEKVTIAYKFINGSNIPDDKTLEQDLETLMRAYDNYVLWNAPNPPARTLLDDIFDSSLPPDREEKSSVYTIDQFASETGFDKQTIKNWERMITRKKQLIFQGPPGTGKTFIAEKLAQLVTSGTSGFYRIVQFHPDFSYQDFIQGYFPEPNSQGGLYFKPKKGLFLEFCEKAKERKSPCVLIIDEINRANLSHVFGELMYLLEYREKDLQLACGDRFKIPENLMLIGTMNTADRSIALVDHALRRRFSFCRLMPEYTILENYLKANGLPWESLPIVLKEINATINNPNYYVGISFFMRDKKTLGNYLEIIWRTEVEPYLDEFFYDQHKEVDAFRWDRLIKGKLSEWSQKA